MVNIAPPRRLGSYLARAAYTSLLLLAAWALVGAVYKQLHFGGSQIDEIIFYFRNGLADGTSGNAWGSVLATVPWALGLAALLALPLGWLRRWRWRYASSLVVLGLAALLVSFGVPQYIQALLQSSRIYEQHYANPAATRLTFPAHKRNLVHIYVESLENTVASRAHGGQAEQSLIPELEQLALHNTNFSHRATGLGGAQPAHGTGWTVGGMVAQSGGIPLKTSLLGQDHNSYGYYRQFLPGAVTLGDILHKQGYQQSFIMGSGASFGGRDKLLSQHGNYHIIDHNEAKRTGRLPKDYLVWWGYEDAKLFDYARAEASRLAASGKPFNLQLLTADTHYTNGYLDKDCPTPHAHKYDNVHACSSRRIANFITWLRQQPFAATTTIVITGDHLGMQTSYYSGKIADPGYQRTIYNAFINPAATPMRRAGRQLTSFDIYPTTLAAMGVKIDGERLGLGTNLFSGKATLAEELGGIDALNAELTKRSGYYEQRIMVQR